MNEIINGLKERIKNEPVAVMAVIEALLGVLVVFGIPMTPEQSFAVLVLAGAILTLIARQQVTPTRKLNQTMTTETRGK